MRVLVAATVCLAIASACSSGTSIEDAADKDVSKKPSQWVDPGAQPEPPLEASTPGAMDASMDAATAITDATMSLPDAASFVDAGGGDAGPGDGG